MKKLEDKLGYRFHDAGLLEHALTHSSYANEHRGTGITSNERLEFLGDSVLGLIVAEYLYQTHPDMPEGELTRTRAALVCEDSLHEVALALNLGSYLRLGKGEAAGGGRTRPSILADATEAMLAAVYLDGGFGAAWGIVQNFILNQEREKAVDRDYKTGLQECVQRTPGKNVTYRLVEEIGPDHNRIFVMEAAVDGKVVGQGRGRTKKEAEQLAAKTALEHMDF
ncbi:MAG TPA: ribonuclease III [Candidatus Enterenecus stercoripullorum]|nr:ribonuclease III [Candidatus Enterenecus stercoripullorum]